MKLIRHNSALFAVIALLAACSSTGTFQGKLVDAATGAPRANERLVAKAATGDDATCQTREGTTGADGTFTIAETCADLTYELAPADKTLAMDAPVSFAGGAPATASGDIKVWRAPRGDGVYIIADDKISSPLTKAADVYWEPVFSDPTNTKTYEKALYASSLPDPITKVPAGGFLVIAGADNLANLKIQPLIDHPDPLAFPHPEKPDAGAVATLSGASWVGVRFSGDKVSTPADMEHVDAKIDATKVKELKDQGWAARIIPAAALADGRYALLADGDSRMYIVQVGEGMPIPPGSPLQAGNATIKPEIPLDKDKKANLQAEARGIKKAGGKNGR